MISKTGVRRAKIHKHTIEGVDKKKELIFIFFSMCLPAILLFASTSVASATNYMPHDEYSFTIESAPYTPVSDPKGPYTGTEGVPITFDGSGSYDPDGSIVAYAWDFGDGNNTTGVAPTHTYAQNGTYTLTLRVTDNGGATNTSTTTATIADTEPVADFSATPTSGPGPLTVAFTDNSTSYDGIEAWKWDFDNDGVTDSNVQNPTHVYAEEGVYTVSLTVTESDGDSETMTKADYITVTKVNNAPYTPANPSPSDGAMDVPVDADLSWTGGDPDAGDIVTYDVYFGTSISPPLVSGNQSGTSYDPGTLDHSTEYHWQIVAKDNHNVSNESDIWSFTTAASPGPDLVGEWHFDEGTGDIAVDSSGNGNDGALVNNPTWVKGKIGKALSFDGETDYISIPNSPSLNPADEITIIAWVKPGVIPQSGWNKIIAKPYTSYTSPWQQYALTLHDKQFVFELNTEGTKDGIIGTGTLDPNTWYHVAGTYDGSEMRIYINAELNGTQPKTGAIAQYPTNVHIGAGIYSYAQVEYINGIVDEVKIYNWALGAEEIRADYEAGSSNNPPVADPNGPYTGMEVVPILFNGSGSYDPDGTIVSYLWDFGDDNNATEVNPTHTYAQNGTYNVTLTVTDNDGATNTSTTTANIESDLIPPYTTGYSPAKAAIEVAKNTTIVVHVKDDGAGVDITSIVMTVNGITVTPIITGTPADYMLTYVPSTDFEYGQIVNVTVDVHDLATAP